MNISDKALKVINLVKSAVSNSITGVTFVSIRNYTNSHGEISNYLINVGIKYQSAKNKDIEFLKAFKPEPKDFKSDIGLVKQAANELLASFIRPDKVRSEGQINAYTTIFDGVKVHNETGVLYIYGYKEQKNILVNGTYPKINSAPLTIAKNEIKNLLRTGKFSEFSIEVGNTIKANGQTLEL